jgi:hypothetical protein
MHGLHLMDLHVLGCVKWEPELCRGIMRARCYPFNLQEHLSHDTTVQVPYKICIKVVPWIYLIIIG